jgi:hypothetical protein
VAQAAQPRALSIIFRVLLLFWASQRMLESFVAWSTRPTQRPKFGNVGSG